MEDKTKLIKTAADLVITSGINGIVLTIVNASTPNDIPKGAKIARKVAGCALASCIAHHTCKYVEHEVDEFAKMIKSMREDIEKEETNGRTEG